MMWNLNGLDKKIRSQNEIYKQTIKNVKISLALILLEELKH